MKIEDIHRIFPISWICESPTFRKYIEEVVSESNNELIVADFASGEHDRVPSFFVVLLPKLLSLNDEFAKSIYVYSTDIHAIRLDSLLGKLEEFDLLQNVRVVNAKLESMDKEAILRPAMKEYLDNNIIDGIWLDKFLISERKFPLNCFDIGILNNDVIGYMMEYYTEYSDALAALAAIHRVIKKNGLLIVTMPCSLYVIDNVTLLREYGFEFVEGMDINIVSKDVVFIGHNHDPNTMSRPSHYTALMFTKK